MPAVSATYDVGTEQFALTWNGSLYDSSDRMYVEHSGDSGSTWTLDEPWTTAVDGWAGISGALSAGTYFRIILKHSDGGWSEPSNSVVIASGAITSGTNDGDGTYEFTWDGTAYDSYGGYVMEYQYSTDITNPLGWTTPEWHTTAAVSGWGAISGLNAYVGYYVRIAVVPTSGEPVWSDSLFIGAI